MDYDLSVLYSLYKWRTQCHTDILTPATIDITPQINIKCERNLCDGKNVGLSLQPRDNLGILKFKAWVFAKVTTLLATYDGVDGEI